VTGANEPLPLGLQLYTLNDQLAADFTGTLAKVAKIGFGSVELAGFHGRDASQIACALADAGLICRSAHIPAQSMGDGPSLDGDLDVLADAMHVIGVDTVVLPAFPIPPRLRVADMTMDAFRAIGTAMTQADWRATADFLNDKGQALASRSLRIGYHNHNFEFAPLGDGTAMDFLLASTDPATVSFEMDVGWVVAAGLAALDLLDTHPGRFIMVHIKDILSSTQPNVRLEQEPADLGDGAISLRPDRADTHKHDSRSLEERR